MPKNPFRSNKKRQKKKKDKRSVSDDESVGSLPSQIGFSDASNNIKQIPGQSTASKTRSIITGTTDGDNDTVASTHTGISVDPNVRKRAITEKNASSKHNLGVFYISKQDWPKAQEYLEIALDARKEVFGKKDGRVAETQIFLAEIHAALGQKTEAIKLLNKAQATIKAIKEKKGKEEETKHHDPTEKKIDLDRLAETCIEKLEDLGVKTAKFVRKGKLDDAPSGADIFGQDYELMKSRERSLSDPDVFMQVMKTEDLNQDQINKGMTGLNNELPDTEIYYSYTFDEEFADAEIAPLITIIPQVIPHSEEHLHTYTTTDDSDDSSMEEVSPLQTSSTNLVGTSDEGSQIENGGDSLGKNKLFGVMKKTLGKLDDGLTDAFNNVVDLVQLPCLLSESDNASVKSDDVSMSSSSTISIFTRDTRQAERVQRKRIKLDAITKLNNASLMFTNGDIFGAERYYKENMEEWTDILGYENPCIINAKEDLGDIAFSTGNYIEAKRHYGLAMRTTKRVFDDEPHHDSVRLLEKLAMANMKLDQTDTAHNLYNDAIDMANELKKYDTEIGSVTEEDALYHIAGIYFKASNYSMAQATLAKIIRLLRYEGHKTNPKVHNLIGMIFFAEKKYSDAKLYFEKAFQGSKRTHGFSKRLKVQILYNLGNSSNQVGFFENALNYFLWALDEIEIGEFCDFDKKTELIRLYTNIGHSYFHLGNLDEAYDYYTKAYVIDVNLFDSDTSESVLNLRLYIGVTRSHQGKYDDALWTFEEILYSQKTDDWPNDVLVGKVLLDMSEIYFVCGSLHLPQKHQVRLSKSCIKRAFEIFSHHKLRSDHAYVKQGNQLKELMRQEIYGTDRKSVV